MNQEIINELSEAMGISQSNVTNMINSFAAKTKLSPDKFANELHSKYIGKSHSLCKPSAESRGDAIKNIANLTGMTPEEVEKAVDLMVKAKP